MTFMDTVSDPQFWVDLVVTFAFTAVLIYFAAKIVTDKSSIILVFATAILGSLAAVFIFNLVGGQLGVWLALAAWALVAGILFGTSWLRGALIGVVAFLLNWLIHWVTAKFF